MLDVTLPIAFIFGLISFVSPCVLPLVPAYVSYLGGRMLYEADLHTTARPQSVDGSGQAVARRGASMRFGMLLHGLAFVSGFTLVFVLLGVLTTALLAQIGGANISTLIAIISRLGGLLIIFFGLHFSGLLSSGFRWIRRSGTPALFAAFVALLTLGGAAALVWGFAGRLAIWQPGDAFMPVWPDIVGLAAAAVFVLLLALGGAYASPRAFVVKLVNTVDMLFYADTRRQMAADGSNGLVGSLLMGIVFSAGWSPCIGTVYGSILTVSAQTGDVARASLQLAAYSLGLGIPFLLAAVAMDSVQGLLRRINRRMRTIRLVSGLLLVVIGVLVATGELQRVTLQLSSGELADFSLQLENDALDAFNIPR